MRHVRQILKLCVLVTSLCSCVSLPVKGQKILLSTLLESSEVFSSSLMRSQASAYSAGEGLAEDGYLDLGKAKVKVRRQAVTNRTRLWPGGIVPYILDQAYTQEIRDKIEVAMREIEHNVGSKTQLCVQFVPRSTEINYLDVRLGKGCISVIGLDYTGPQVSNYSLDCAVKGSIMHELLHTLGLYHEMDRYDRDDFLSINFTNMIDGAGGNFVLKNKSDIDTLGTPYDYTSIMQYGPYSFSKDQRYPVITPKPQFSHDVWMGQRSALSHLDVLRVQRLYGCEEDTSHIASDISEDNRLVWCDFESGICNLTASVTSNGDEEGSVQDRDQDDQTKNGQANKVFWTVTSNPTPDGPVAGTTNGLDSFFYASKEYCELVSMGASNQTESTAAESTESTEKDRSSTILIETTTIPVRVTPTSARAYSSTDAVQQTSNVTGTTVSLVTPLITSTSYVCCVEYRIFQAGLSSYVDMYVFGPQIPRIQLASLRGQRRDHWATVIMSLQLIPGIQFYLELSAVLDQGSVSFDNLHIIKGACQ